MLLAALLAGQEALAATRFCTADCRRLARTDNCLYLCPCSCHIHLAHWVFFQSCQ